MSNFRLKPTDSAWLLMESNDTPMHVGVLAIFHLPKRAAKGFIADMAARLIAAEDFVAPWNSRLASTGASLNPRLVEDTAMDVGYHLRRSALPEPGGERELGQIVSRLHSVPLDRKKPLWELHLIEGLEGNRFAFYLKIHHAIIDDVNGIAMLLSTLSPSATAKNMRPFWCHPLKPLQQASGDINDHWLTELFTSTGAIASISKAGSGLLGAVLKPKDTNSFLSLRGTPRSTLNRHINNNRRFATQQFSQARIQALADATDSTLNEMLTYLCSSSLRRFFKEYNVLPDDSLIAVMPVSLHTREELVTGNAIAGLRVMLATHLGDPLARLNAIKQAMQEVREDRASLPDEAISSYVLLRAAPLFAGQLLPFGRFVPPAFNLAVSNTATTDKPMYFNGCRLEAVYPMAQLMQFSALSIDCVSYAGTLNIGFTGALDTLPHLQRMAVYMGKAVDDLEELVAGVPQ